MVLNERESECREVNKKHRISPHLKCIFFQETKTCYLLFICFVLEARGSYSILNNASIFNNSKLLYHPLGTNIQVQPLDHAEWNDYNCNKSILNKIKVKHNKKGYKSPPQNQGRRIVLLNTQNRINEQITINSLSGRTKI